MLNSFWGTVFFVHSVVYPYNFLSRKNLQLIPRIFNLMVNVLKQKEIYKNPKTER